MPMHDWSCVDIGVYHHFHQGWTVEIADHLNRTLPTGYAAMLERHDGPPVDRVERPALDAYAARGNRISIQSPLGRPVCVIEVVSPGNKHSRLALRSFVEKSSAFLRAGVQLLLIDPFPPTENDPQGIHRALFDESQEPDFRFTAAKPLTLAAYMIDDTGLGVPAYVVPFAVGTTLPDMPAYLDWDEYVPVPLEATYQEAWSKCPATMRELVEMGRLSDGG